MGHISSSNSSYKDRGKNYHTVLYSLRDVHTIITTRPQLRVQIIRNGTSRQRALVAQLDRRGRLKNSLEQDILPTTPQNEVKQQNYGVLCRQRPIGGKNQNPHEVQKEKKNTCPATCRRRTTHSQE
jgi:hypothetical protein